MVWRSPDSDPLDADECSRVRRLQIALRAHKVCTSCGKPQLVYRFSSYGAGHCEACMNTPLEPWWAQQKARVA
jgi:ribosomal protein L37AE/L43A